MEDELDSIKTLDQLGIKEGDSIFIRKRNDGMEEIEADQGEYSGLICTKSRAVDQASCPSKDKLEIQRLRKDQIRGRCFRERGVSTLEQLSND